MTGFSPATRQIIINRAESFCERCCANNPSEIHHRRPRGAGGSRDPLTNTPANGALLCRGCHLWVESHRTDAYDFGWLIRQGHSPDEVPILWRSMTWVLLRTDGRMEIMLDRCTNEPA